MILNSIKAILLVICIFSFSIKAQPEIHFSEYRVLITEKISSHKYGVSNRGNTPAQCTASLSDYAVSADGKLTKLSDESTIPTSAAAMLRVSPKRFDLLPNKSQKIKILARGLRQKPTGEWVSYLTLSCKDKDFAGENMVNVHPKFVYQIPVIVRKGTLHAKLDFIDAKLSTNKVAFTLDYTGNRSLYGDITVYDEKSNQIGKVKGLSVYQQVTQMPMAINLSQPAIGSKLTIEFVENKKFGSAKQSVELML